MDLEEQQRRTKRRLRIFVLVLLMLPFFGAMAFGVFFFFGARDDAHERDLIEQVSGAAFGCVASMRGDAPEPWGLERALEHMSRMERATRDAPVDRPDRQRFLRHAQDAARGCQALATLTREAQRDAPQLYFAVPARLAQPIDADDAEPWFRRTLPQSRAEVLELTRQVRAMNAAINTLRSGNELMAVELAVEGRGASPLARVVELTPLPRQLEAAATEAWPLEEHVVVLRRGSVPRVVCETRFIDRASCYEDFVQTLGYDGQLGAQRALERPARVLYWSAFAPSRGGTIWAVGKDERNRGIVGRYPPGGTTAELGSLAAPIDAAATMASVIGGVAVFTSDLSVFVSQGETLRFARASEVPPPIITASGEGGAAAGIHIDGLATLAIFGSSDEGFTARWTSGTSDVFVRLLDARTNVREVVSVRALSSGHAVALLLRQEAAPDAVLLSRDFGQTWLSD